MKECEKLMNELLSLYTNSDQFNRPNEWEILSKICEELLPKSFKKKSKPLILIARLYIYIYKNFIFVFHHNFILFNAGNGQP